MIVTVVRLGSRVTPSSAVRLSPKVSAGSSTESSGIETFTQLRENSAENVSEVEIVA